MRFRRRPLGRRLFRPHLHPFRRRLRQANRWVESGRPVEAAQSFTELAQAAADHERPIASQLYLQAFRGYLAAGEIELAKSRLLQGIRLMIDQEDPRLGPVASRLCTELRRDGHLELAQAVEQIIPSRRAQPAPEFSAAASPGLPAKCPFCGGNVHHDQVDRTDPERPACAYCGSPLLGDDPSDD